jgi:hypothetical protein
MQARSPEIRAEWLEIALEWEKFAEQLSAQQREKRQISTETLPEFLNANRLPLLFRMHPKIGRDFPRFS